MILCDPEKDYPPGYIGEWSLREPENWKRVDDGV